MTDTLPLILLAGFAPFGGESSNPSAEAVHALDGETVAGHRIVALELPVVFGESLRALEAAIGRHAPALVLAVGQAGGRTHVSLERIAINVDDARIADNAGAQPVDVPVVADGPAAYFSTLPIKAMLLALREAGLPCEISQTAGTFVCNHVFYGLMHALRARPGTRGGFVHIPWSPAQAAARPGAPSMPVATVVEALRIALGVALTTRTDVAVGGGAEH
ncbi:pyroglutamyl-peptidase I [Coralloluteibacterium stylophorae]|uniref:Pyrrolidone-carboxylate peptidase n=1 Tax=Coralloluteibacterium stylophorae TaxID=1776034 RepID=A0A8J7VVA0_9GAMM|nr:pyroglutamyl-peptidase I [Coralloluteibacterium stylophorae]MBS7458734.1 pyroglutamyl-peptidase I [Coralloluteibacterium stylophorae]